MIRANAVIETFAEQITDLPRIHYKLDERLSV